MTDTETAHRTIPLERDALIAEARRRTGLDDIGDTWFHEPLDKMLEHLKAEANLNAAGEVFLTDRLVNYLTNRLLRVKLLKDHPEILDEDIKVSAAILSLGRTGSTKTYRLLSSAPSNTAMKWWEGFFPYPMEGEEFGNPVERRRLAQQIKDQMPDMEPVFGKTTIDSAEEEVLIIDHAFVGTTTECFFWSPSYIEWLKGFDQMPAYQELKVALQILQWQVPSRRGKYWILKSPTHMSAPKTLLDTFPGALIIQTHRDPVKTMPSHCSMITPLYGISSDSFDAKVIGRHTSARWAGMTNDVIDLREKIGDERFVDIQFQDMADRPIEVMRGVFERMGREMTAEDQAAMEQHLIDNKRDKWAPHIYDLDTYGLSEEIIASDFARYRERHILNG